MLNDAPVLEDHSTKKDKVISTPLQNNLPTDAPRLSIISIAKVIENVKDENIVKYLPDGLINDEQVERCTGFGGSFNEEGMLLFDEELMSFAMGNCIVSEDTNGNRILFKYRREQKIDNVAALMDSCISF
ncbi:MAG: hypothetical protein IKS39_01090 [Clostridia bacterium]|nr:hypothetical protein [Clostridia bacterium]